MFKNGCSIKRSGNAGLETSGWTLGFVVEMMVSPNITKEDIADELTRSFLSYEGKKLDLAEFTLFSRDDICPKVKWNSTLQKCNKLTVDSYNWYVLYSALSPS